MMKKEPRCGAVDNLIGISKIGVELIFNTDFFYWGYPYDGT